ncbi:type 2 lantibiotic biosynthesis protein LanM [Litoreibacter meonggei]|uniref:Type 2 lantibiotic biosynthesis protein LanM n=1 Tax=Litoreibacter meonggei TaxID=1049199 RepID=A0A497X630_9RHOB|nr:DUF4135 domain-containing protein [Litoreibacter meonggei]RLJ60756.1 type 2 lantibiotic biosynthesis protein LanM [Litoreibacter meonggei]
MAAPFLKSIGYTPTEEEANNFPHTQTPFANVEQQLRDKISSYIFYELAKTTKSKLSYSDVFINTCANAILGQFREELLIQLYQAFDRYRPLQCSVLPGEYVQAIYLTRFEQEVLCHPERVGVLQDSRLHIVFERIQHCIDSVIEMLIRLEADQGEIQALLQKENDPLLKASQIEVGCSDPHNLQRAVMIVTFECGERIVYKPRSLRNEEFINQVIGFVNSVQSRIALTSLNVIVRRDYGWQEYCASCAPRNFEERRKLHERLGALHAIAHGLCITDCHHENVLFFGQYPYLIDVETLGHCRPKVEIDIQKFLGIDSSYEFPSRTGFFPEWLAGTGDDAPNSIRSGALLKNDKISSTKYESTFLGVGTDGIILDQIKERRSDLEEELVSRLGVDAIEFVDDIESAFSDTYLALIACKDKILSLLTPQDDIISRFIFRDTHDYLRILNSMRYWGLTDPKRLLSRAFKLNPHLPQTILFSEVEAVLNGDVPKFEVALHERLKLFDGKNWIFLEFYLTPFEMIERQLRSMSADRLVFDRRLIIGSILSFDETLRKGALVSESQSDFRSSKKAMHEPILNDTHQDVLINGHNKAALVASLHRLADGTRFSYVPMEVGFGRGIAGLTTYLSVARDIDPQTGTDLFDLLLMKISSAIEHQTLALHGPNSHLVRLGLADGLGGLLFSSALMSNFYKNPILDKILNSIPVDALISRLSSETKLDVFDGVAGLLVGLAAVAKKANDPSRLALIEEIHEVFLKHIDELTSNRSSVGVAHGLSGVGLALAASSTHVKNVDIDSVIGAILDIEQLHWQTSGVVEKFHSRCATSNSWCSGTPGYLLLRKFLGREMENDPVYIDFNSSHIQQNETLCCGSTGEWAVRSILNGLDGVQNLPKTDFERTKYMLRDWSMFNGVSGVELVTTSPKLLKRIISLGIL